MAKFENVLSYTALNPVRSSPDIPSKESNFTTVSEKCFWIDFVKAQSLLVELKEVDY